MWGLVALPVLIAIIACCVVALTLAPFVMDEVLVIRAWVRNVLIELKDKWEKNEKDQENG